MTSKRCQKPAGRAKLKRQRHDVDASMPSIQSLLLAFATWIPFSLERLSPVLSEEAGHDSNRSPHAFAGKFAAVTMSTSFSGVGAPEQALVNISQFFVMMLGTLALNDFSLSSLFAVEIDQHCRDELLFARFVL